jgi:hypothetical protein
MIVVQLCGGLGNQLFQYATARRLATRLGVPLRVDLRYYTGTQREPAFDGHRRTCRLQAFHTQITPIERSEFIGLKLLHVKERALGFHPGVLNLPDNVYLEGYWQCPRYFGDAAALVRREFALRDGSVAALVAGRLRRLRSDGRPLVAVHVRRGDMALAHEQLRDPWKMYGPLAGRDYYQAAMQRFDYDVRFVVFSDSPADLDWCRQNLRGRRVCFLHGPTDLHDFAALQACDHLIMANSTFSWWAAWLNPRPGRRVIVPRAWFYPHVAPGHDLRELVPADWELLGPPAPVLPPRPPVPEVSPTLQQPVAAGR